MKKKFTKTNIRKLAKELTTELEDNAFYEQLFNEIDDYYAVMRAKEAIITALGHVNLVVGRDEIKKAAKLLILALLEQ